MENRIENLRKKLINNDVDGIIFSSKYNKLYITGFTGSKGFVLITLKNKYLIIDGKYKLQAKEQSSEFKIIEFNKSIGIIVSEIVEEEKIKRLAFEGEYLVYTEYKEFLDKVNCELVSKKDIIETIRGSKNEEEINFIRRACEIGDLAFSETLEYIKGRKNNKLTEKEIGVFLENTIIRLGGENSFDIIVASGERGALPHGRATSKIIENGEFITIDFGVVFNRYRSDMTRTFSVGEPNNKKLVEIYEIVKKSQELGVEFSKEGESGASIDKVCRDYIGSFGYLTEFVHGTGHGVGLEGHECLSISKNSKDNILKNSVITIEPGIYIEGLGGVRIEDTILVNGNEVEILTKSPKELIIL